MTKKLAFIGSGNMATALINGLLADGYAADSITASDQLAEKRENLAGSGIHCVLVVPGPIDTEIWDKVEDDNAYSGKLYPAQLVADEIIKAIRERRFEVTVPRRNPQLVSARLFSLLIPSAVRKGVARMNPVTPEMVRGAVERARQGLRMGVKNPEKDNNL